MKFDRFDYTVWGVGAALGLAITGVILLGDQVGARIQNTFPTPEGKAGAFSRIGIEFAQVMQTKTVEAAFQLEPPTTGRFEWQGRQMWFIPDQPLQPGAHYTVHLETGPLSQGGQLLKRALTWSFNVQTPWIVYIASPNGARELWRTPVSGGTPEQLSSTGGSVYDFDVSPDGSRIAYAVVNEQGGSDLWRMAGDGAQAETLVSCGPDRCYDSAWAPDGLRLAYSRENVGIERGAPHGPPRAWIVDSATGRTEPTHPDPQALGFSPSWSPDGKRLAFFDGGAGGIRVLHLQTKAEMLLPTQTGAVGAWSPDSTRMLFTGFDFSGAQPFTALYSADLVSQTIEPYFASDQPWRDYSVPAWSPTGEWIVMSLKRVDDAVGKLWMMRPNGQDARAITEAPNYSYMFYRWDPWGQAIVFERLALDRPYPTPEIMIWSLANGETRLVVENASGAQWLP